ncbi:pyridoxal phosphate-dependent aminotransferase [Flammeovirga yaeyamensis]|uniref:alanine transaminase n=1 Tax=Flammeovirga yaeyamensis TaxID=367791 RepID=A0AAX1N6U8_9BACT|nr:pyridoxal phosphate-dependent aminotransferase [Flammeovirga yaeyamensis]MBB3697822.1 aspartate/methionine/tyrosine aminotransferase [Flammeovirga yaeyamensis]NMF35822.1 pyridoxal phosphate-dependent aminotransferase [Flammeovirga yaeyamensis]QWG03226.1 pyridoxal phosphate-dependent aminotransferase [Flammeovirga yaeyamensis]
MRKKLLRDGANELSYEIRGIVKKAEILQKEGKKIYWENIGDPIQKNAAMPDWMLEIISGLIQENSTFGYCHSKGVLETREFLAEQTNLLNGVQITANDILFFNGLGDAISKLYQFLVPTSRIIGPSPAYSTHSSAEAAHANTTPLTYKLDPKNHWYPDMDDLYLKIKYNPNIVGILIINPDNPTGMVYPKEILDRFVEIAKEFNLFLVSDEIYANVTYNGAEAIRLAEYIQDVPGIALKGISKEFPWPGSRCGWMEYYNKESDPQFSALCQTLDNAKMIEVCSTKLPQMAIPRIMKDPRYLPYRKEANKAIGKRAEIIASLLGDLPQLTFNKTYGAFYNTIIFKDGVLKQGQSLKIDDPKFKALRDEWVTEDMPLDKQFVYNLLAAKGVCVVPISSFCSELVGFRVTLLEENEELLKETFTHIREAVIEYCESK